jgi:hypothetical protein
MNTDPKGTGRGEVEWIQHALDTSHKGRTFLDKLSAYQEFIVKQDEVGT